MENLSINNSSVSKVFQNTQTSSEQKVTGKVLFSDGNVNILNVNGKVMILNSSDGKKLPEGTTVSLTFTKDASNLSQANLKNIDLVAKNLGSFVDNKMNLNIIIGDKTLPMNFDISQLPQNQRGKFILWVSEFIDSLNMNLDTSLFGDKIDTSVKENNLMNFIKSTVSEFSKDFFSPKLSYTDPQNLGEKLSEAFKDFFTSSDSSSIKNNKTEPQEIKSDQPKNLFQNSDNEIKNNSDEVPNQKSLPKEPHVVQKESYEPVKSKDNEKNLNNEPSLSETTIRQPEDNIQDNSQLSEDSINNNSQDLPEKNDNTVEKKPEDSKEQFSSKEFSGKQANRTTGTNPSSEETRGLQKNIKQDIQERTASDNKNNDIQKESDKTETNFNKDTSVKKDIYSNLIKNAVSDKLLINRKNSEQIKQHIENHSKLNEKEIIKNESQNTASIKENKNNIQEKTTINTNINQKNHTLPESKIMEKDLPVVKEKIQDNIQKQNISLKNEITDLKSEPNKNTLLTEQNTEIKKQNIVQNETPFSKPGDSIFKHSEIKHNIPEQSRNLSPEPNFINQPEQQTNPEKLPADKLPVNEQFKSASERIAEKAINAYKSLDSNSNNQENNYMLMNMAGIPVFMNFRKINENMDREAHGKIKNYGRLRMVLPTDTFGLTDINLYMNEKDVIIRMGVDNNMDILKSDSEQLDTKIKEMGYNLIYMDIYENEETVVIEPDKIL